MVYVGEERKGHACLLLPAYSAELHWIEVFWKKMKHEGLPLKSFTTCDLDLAIGKSGDSFGSKYQLTSARN